MPVTTFTPRLRSADGGAVMSAQRDRAVASVRRADLDGLRGLAIALVVVFHVWFGRVSGGVDVFLALSGFFFVGSLLRVTESAAPLDPRPVLRRVGRRLLAPLVLVLTAVAVGTVAGGPLGDRFGRKYVIWFSILGALPFTLLLPFASLFWTGPLTVAIGLILASAFPAIVVFAQELAPGKVGMISGLFFGFSFGMGGIGAAALGWMADQTSIETVYRVCAYLPAIGLLAAFLPDIEKRR